MTLMSKMLEVYKCMLARRPGSSMTFDDLPLSLESVQSSSQATKMERIVLVDGRRNISSGTSVWISTTLHISEISMTFEELPVSREYAK